VQDGQSAQLSSLAHTVPVAMTCVDITDAHPLYERSRCRALSPSKRDHREFGPHSPATTRSFGCGQRTPSASGPRMTQPRRLVDPALVGERQGSQLVERPGGFAAALGVVDQHVLSARVGNVELVVM
jgi:hypothetical protein